MTDITELALLVSKAKASVFTLEYISQFEPADIDSDDVDLRFEVDGRDTGTNVSIVDECRQAAKVIGTLVEALEKAQGMEAYWKTQCRGITDHGEELQARIAELESRTVKLSPELYTIGDLIRTQDNRITDQPMFVVFQKREIIGSDEHSPSRICWVWDGEEVSELRAKRLDALYQDGRDTRGYDRYAMQEVDEFVTACFTEHGCKDYLRQNGHNLRLPYIYACGSFRNNEYQLVRNWLAGIKVEAER
ncbi:ead/Ea22-like family protein [Klebsiella pneumoniae]